MTERERFCAVLSNGPVYQSDAVVLLCGEDCGPRIAVAAQIMLTGGAHGVLVSGGRDEPPRWIGAEKAFASLLGAGVASGKIMLDRESQNTREQAVNAVELAVEKEWKRLLIAASPYHQYRAFLTFLRALQEAGKADEIQIMSVPASQAPWFDAPAGMEQSRADLLAVEFAKVEEYTEHVATYAEGLVYLETWEGR